MMHSEIQQYHTCHQQNATAVINVLFAASARLRALWYFATMDAIFRGAERWGGCMIGTEEEEYFPWRHVGIEILGRMRWPSHSSGHSMKLKTYRLYPTAVYGGGLVWIMMGWGGYETRSSLPSMHPLIHNYSTQPHSDPLENLIEHLIWPALSPLIDIYFSIRSHCRHYIGSAIVTILFMDILWRNDLLCW